MRNGNGILHCVHHRIALALAYQFNRAGNRKIIDGFAVFMHFFEGAQGFKRKRYILFFPAYVHISPAGGNADRKPLLNGVHIGVAHAEQFLHD